MYIGVSFPRGSAVKNLLAVQTQETLVQSLGLEDLLKEGIAMHSGILTWKIPWTEKPRGLQSRPSSPVWPRDQSLDLSPNASGGLNPFSPPSELQEINLSPYMVTVFL